MPDIENRPKEIPEYNLDKSFYKVHKGFNSGSVFGLDHTDSLICNGFGLYSSAGLRQKIGPIKSTFYRIGFGVSGTVEIHCGLEQFHFTPGCIAFTIPGQIFSLHDKSEDLLAYYMLFTEDFIADAVSLKQIRNDFPFLNYQGQQVFRLEELESNELHYLIFKINDEVQENKKNLKQAIQLYLQLIFLQAYRGYEKLELDDASPSNSSHSLLKRFKKLVGQYCIQKRKVGDYAEMLHITANHLNRVVKDETGKVAHELIDEMINLEAKALLLHTDLSVAEAAYQLNFTDPSHFNKFFKKLNGMTPLSFRKR